MELKQHTGGFKQVTRGQVVVIGIFGFSLLGVGFNFWFQHQQTREALAFWGGQTADLIASPQYVELRQLEPVSDDNALTGPLLVVDGTSYVATEIRDVTKARGFHNARHAFTVSDNFDWNPPDCEPTWSHALVFTTGDRKATVLISLDCQRIKLAKNEKTAGIALIAEGLEILFNEQLGSSSGVPKENTFNNRKTSS